MSATTPEPAHVERLLGAVELLEGVARRTPVATSRTLDERIGGEVFLKCENLQRVGAFKFRGAYHAISRLSAAERSRGVLTYSSGNHAQAVALAAKILGVEATIVMPESVVEIKRKATEGYGARVVLHGPETTREALAAEIQEREKLTLVPPFDHLDIIAGQGTAAVELHREVEGLGLVLTPCGGGGLLAGTAIATRHLTANCRVVGVEPELADDAARSFHSGVLQTVDDPPTIADGTRTPSLGELNFALIRQLVDDMVTVDEDAIREAVRFLALRLKLVVEPSGALGVAALLSGAVEPAARSAAILSGGNVEPSVLAEILTG